MRSTQRRVAVLFGLVLAAAAAQAAGSVQVSFVQPAQFTDAGDAFRDGDRHLLGLKSHIEQLAVRHLGDGQHLSIEVLDVDLAGDYRNNALPNRDLRVLRGAADWPRIKLRYALSAAGQAPRSGEASLADMAYLQRFNAYRDLEPLRHEKRMLDEWFAAQFPPATR